MLGYNYVIVCFMLSFLQGEIIASDSHILINNMATHGWFSKSMDRYDYAYDYVCTNCIMDNEAMSYCPTWDIYYCKFCLQRICKHALLGQDDKDKWGRKATLKEGMKWATGLHSFKARARCYSSYINIVQWNFKLHAHRSTPSFLWVGLGTRTIKAWGNCLFKTMSISR